MVREREAERSDSSCGVLLRRGRDFGRRESALLMRLSQGDSLHRELAGHFPE